ncbi:unnamed protein product [Amaranthus hypochondriacus]
MLETVGTEVSYVEEIYDERRNSRKRTGIAPPTHSGYCSYWLFLRLVLVFSFWLILQLVLVLLILVAPLTRFGIAHLGCSFNSFWYCSFWLLHRLVLVVPLTCFGIAP